MVHQDRLLLDPAELGSRFDAALDEWYKVPLEHFLAESRVRMAGAVPGGAAEGSADGGGQAITLGARVTPTAEGLRTKVGTSQLEAAGLGNRGALLARANTVASRSQVRGEVLQLGRKKIGLRERAVPIAKQLLRKGGPADGVRRAWPCHLHALVHSVTLRMARRWLWVSCPRWTTTRKSLLSDCCGAWGWSS